MPQAHKFFLDLIEEWKGWLTGSLPMAGLAVVSLATPISLPIWLWVVLVFIAGFIVAMFRVYARLQSRIDSLESQTKPRLALTFGGQAGAVSQVYGIEKHWLITVENAGGEQLHDCQIKLHLPRAPLGALPVSISAPFTLRPEDRTQISVLRTMMEVSDKPAEVHELFNANGAWYPTRHPIIFDPGVYEIVVEAFAANSRPSRLSLLLAHREGYWIVENAPNTP